ncbi:T9SS type A sorting domain-containing protein [Dyadobacter sp. CY261]|uniref:T9SS type A sorting domain-containing protein n=1 Tax=Dyadobacter sp. CY261 TaxID=2907203 RepID=UPI001F3617CB|nr:T9SS type A sorting domain-containing protein [Dyadobacter sp. CY261]MCF0073752.1 T9SS type A sorting domain-containing protein [Dyadobacter sp. CY261]
MKNTLLTLFFICSIFTISASHAQIIQGSLKYGSNSKEVILTVRNNSASPVTGNLTKVMFTLSKKFFDHVVDDGFKFLNIYTLPLPSTGSFSKSSDYSLMVNYVEATWTGSKAIDLDPGESMDLIGFSLSAELRGYSEDMNVGSELFLTCVRSDYMAERIWAIEVDGVDLTIGSEDLFYSTGPTVTTSRSGDLPSYFSCWARMSNFSMTNLPVELNSFIAKNEGNVANLQWSTSEETNSDYFSIEHSRDAKHWTELGKMESQKESTVLNNYDFTHINAAPGINYYRLKMVDLDKTYAYSQIVKVSIDGKGGESIYPNPVLSKFELTNAGLKDVEKVRIFDVSGKLVHETSQVDESGISIGHLASGIFYVELEKAGGDTRKHKILKK